MKIKWKVNGIKLLYVISCFSRKISTVDKKLCIIDEFLNSIFLKISFQMNFIIYFQFVST